MRMFEPWSTSVTGGRVLSCRIHSFHTSDHSETENTEVQTGFKEFLGLFPRIAIITPTLPLFIGMEFETFLGLCVSVAYPVLNDLLIATGIHVHNMDKKQSWYENTHHNSQDLLLLSFISPPREISYTLRQSCLKIISCVMQAILCSFTGTCSLDFSP